MAKNRLLDGQVGALDASAKKIINENFADVSLCTTQLDATSNTTLANITGMATDSITLVAGATYRFTVDLATTANAAGGLKVAFKLNNGCTLTSIEATGKAFTASAVAVQHTTTTTDQTSLISSTAAVIKAEIDGTFVVATAGTIQLQAAQNASNGAATSVYVGSRMEITRVA